ncbi:SprT-like domain-containing protein [Halorussus lipolyticus]|uniref:SprT-like domain-containing protein n=1 Tax=Halorussus lipolyticus TaxID=3034024 RepID=UPI0023E7F0F1|nr:SprT-like domain-containing protein [Halorussus sp. DT80]
MSDPPNPSDARPASGSRLSPDTDPEESPTVRALAHAETDEEVLLGSRAYCREATREYGLDVDLSPVEWEVSTRAKRRAAAVKRPKIPGAEVGEPLDWREAAERTGTSLADLRTCTLSLTRAAFDAFDVGEWTATLRHELVHVEQFQRFGATDHGPAFRERAEAVSSTVNCPPFADPKYVLRCGECETVVGRRYRECKLVREYDEYRSSCCGSEIVCLRQN